MQYIKCINLYISINANIFHDRKCIICFNNLFWKEIFNDQYHKKFYDKITEVMLDVNSIDISLWQYIV